jgi:hypothetical protein
MRLPTTSKFTINEQTSDKKLHYGSERRNR